jgi:hypothetical protein
MNFPICWELIILKIQKFNLLLVQALILPRFMAIHIVLKNISLFMLTKFKLANNIWYKLILPKK